MRALIAALVLAFGAFVCSVETAGIYTHGTTPQYSSRTLGFGLREIIEISPEAREAGMRVGDRYAIAENWPLVLANEGWASHGWYAAGTVVPMRVQRDGRTIVLQFAARAASGKIALVKWLDILFKLAATLVGAMLIVRGRDRFGVFAGIGIAGAVLTSGFISGISLGSPLTSATVDAIIFMGAVTLRYFIVEAMLAICGEGLRPFERGLIRATAVVASAYMLATILAVTVADFTHNLAIVSAWGNETTWIALWFIAQLSLRVDLLGYLVAWLRPRVADRDVIAWTFVATIAGLAGPSVNLVLRLVGLPTPWFGALNLTLALMVAGYAYVAMRYRIVNLSFVLNRAVVYTAVGALVLAAFVIVEMVATRLAVSQTGSTALEVLIALALGFTIKRLEQRVDSFVERVLFAAKHREEEQLRDLIRDCAHIEHLPALFARACGQSRRILGAQRVTIYEAGEGGYEPLYTSPEGVPVAPADIDDGAFVRLRSRREPIDLEQLESAVGAEGLVFPMLARGRLLGAMYFGPKQRRATYDPDERRLLLELSHEVGASSLVLAAPQSATR